MKRVNRGKKRTHTQHKYDGCIVIKCANIYMYMRHTENAYVQYKTYNNIHDPWRYRDNWHSMSKRPISNLPLSHFSTAGTFDNQFAFAIDCSDEHIKWSTPNWKWWQHYAETAEWQIRKKREYTQPYGIWLNLWHRIKTFYPALANSLLFSLFLFHVFLFRSERQIKNGTVL